ncbi:hypothetical protein B6U81_04770 [Thermoplasmatales archaeon ex4484_30]|nr:MAG: hypothetical protein B6U81_04770 [Thermoplasmatales archaeon ex4484_30]RLC68284.1 MAG: hypothetical protein DRI52_09985 [Chloroflexota bacterium]RLF46391.1 MAG: hypothetical protein DRN29_05160 [Thermoplasmata archaeon]
MENEKINEELKKWMEEHGIPAERKEETEEEEIKGKCEICMARDAKYKCIKCGKLVCPSCYWIMFGVCRECISEDIMKKWRERGKDLGIDWVK